MEKVGLWSWGGVGVGSGFGGVKICDHPIFQYKIEFRKKEEIARLYIYKFNNFFIL